MTDARNDSPIKEYETVHRHDDAVTFRIFRTEDHYAEFGGKTDVPHRHNFYTVVLIRQGHGTHTIDYSSYPIGDHQLFFVSPGQVHHLVEESCTYGFVLLFSTEFLHSNGIEVSFIEDLHLFNDYGDSPPLALSADQLATLSGYCEQIIALEQGNIDFREQAVGAVLKLFLVHAHSFVPDRNSDARLAGAGQDVLRRFKQLVERKFCEWHDAASFAVELGISADHLNRTVKQLMGKTVKETIQSRLVVESKRLLVFSPMTAREICFALGFSEPANFSAFFKKHTGMTPSQFRHRQQVGKS